MPSNSLRVARACCIWMLCVSMWGCDTRPRAPALSDAPVYNNRREGFRFLVPEGWVQSASAVLPDKALEGEVLLVQYRMRTSSRGASLDILCMNAEEFPDLHEYHGLPSQGVRDWKSAAAPEQLSVNGTEAQRFVYEGTLGKERMVKEVVSMRRGQRVYSFIGLFWSEDANAQEELRRAVDSVIWFQ